MIARAAVLTLIVPALFAAPAVLAGQTADGPGGRNAPPGVLGVVVDRETRQPIAGVAVTLRPMAGPPPAGVAGPGPTETLDPTPARSAPDPVLTDDLGRFAFAGERLGDGRYRIEVTRLGYRAIVDSLEYRVALGLRIEAEMVAEALEIEPLLVVAEARSRRLEANGFYDRRARAIGRFVTREDAAERNPLQLTDLLLTMPGVRIRRGTFRGQAVAMLRGGCVADVYINGVRTDQSLGLDALVHPNDLAALEVYQASEVPAQFRTSTCGAVVIWTYVPDVGTGDPITWRRLFAFVGLAVGALLLVR